MTTNTISITVKKSKLAENGDYNLTADRYRETVDYSNTKWPMVELGEVCDLVRGITYGKDDEVEENGLKVLRANNINLDSSLNFEDIKQISINVKLSEDKKLRKDDIFICLASGSKSHIGKVAFVENDTDYYFGGFMGVIRTNQEKQAISKYIFQQLKSSKFNDYLRKEISGVNINNLNSKILSNYKIPLPPLSVQEQIVAEIEQYQKVIDGAKQVVQNWKPSFRIDPSWEVVELGEVCEIYQPKTITSKEITETGKYKVFGANGVIGYFDEYNHEESEVAVTCRGATCGTINFTEPKSWITGNAMVLKPKDKTLNKKYLFYFLSNSNLISTISGAAQPQITRAGISPFQIPLPPLPIQEQIVSEIEAEQKAIEECKKLIAKMQKKVETKIGEVWGEEMK